MIQDIYPHKWDITYKKSTPKEMNRILFFYQDSLFIQQEGNTFPTYKEAERFVKEPIYLFSLDDISLYRVEICEETEKKKIEEMINGQFQPRAYFRRIMPKENGFAGITGLHLNGWYRKNKYCGACQAKLELDVSERMLKCPCCGNMVFPRINPAVIVAVTNQDKLLLTKYKGGSYRNYALVAGFTEIGESFEDTVAREVMEEAGLKVKNIRYYKSQPWAFADDILAGYFCEVDGDSTIIMDSEELSVAEWINREDIDIEPDDTSLTNEMICYFKEQKC